jgi:DNA (cytosine-5)-methyltransferase 1
VLTVGSLFSGIGGFDLGFERAGMHTVWFCEQDAFCQRVLAKHWPGVPCHPDVRALVADTASLGREDGPGLDDRGRPLVRSVPGAVGGTGRRDSAPRVQDGGRDSVASSEGDVGEPLPVPVPYVDVLCGGFPCQDISLAGKGAGIDGSRSGLWREFARLIGELRPRYVVVENVPALTSRGLDRVLGDLAACGFDAEWDHLPASAFGAPHRRDRLWLVAYASSDELWEQSGRGGGESGSGAALAGLNGAARSLADAPRDMPAGSTPTGAERERARARGQRSGADLADTDGRRLEVGPQRNGEPLGPGLEPSLGHDPDGRSAWEFEPDVGRVAHGIPARVERLRSLGNSLVPQIAQWIGERIVSYG